MLCIDNLETLIQDDVNSVQDYIESLPETWKIIVTSRIPIDGAKTFSLQGLEEASSQILVRRYADSIGFSSIGKTEVERIAKSSAANPLAIRLNVDRLHLGGGVADTLKQTSVDLIDFSFHGLIAALPGISKKVLEVIFVVGSSDRGNIVSFFGEETALASEGVGKLLQTSVVRRIVEEDEERIELTESIRLLLQRSPLDLAFRHSASARLGEMRKKTMHHASIQESRNVNPYHEDFLGPWIPEHLGSKLVDVIRFLRDNRQNYADYSQIEKLCQVLESMPVEHRDYSEYWLMLARLRSWQRDELASRSAFENATELEAAEQKNKRPTARLAYARYLKRNNVNDESFSIIKSLINDEWCGRESCKEVYFRVIWGELFDMVIRIPDPDLRDKCLKSLKAATEVDAVDFYQVQEAKVRVSNCSSEHKTNPENVIRLFTDAANNVAPIFGNPNFGKSAYLFSLFFLKELEFLLRSLPLSFRSHLDFEKMLLALERMCEKLFESDGILPRDRSTIQGRLRSLIKFEVSVDNPFDSKKWRNRAGLQAVAAHDLQELTRGGWIVSTITGLGSGSLPGFAFCNDSDANRYYVSRRLLKSVDLVEWTKLEKGHTIAIRNIVENSKPGSYPSPQEIQFIP